MFVAAAFDTPPLIESSLFVVFTTSLSFGTLTLFDDDVFEDDVFEDDVFDDDVFDDADSPFERCDADSPFELSDADSPFERSATFFASEHNPRSTLLNSPSVIVIFLRPKKSF